jgi:hypothetical protein
MKPSSTIRMIMATTILFFGCMVNANAQLSKVKFSKTLMPADMFNNMLGVSNIEKSRIKANGPAVRIYTKSGNFRLQSILSEDDNHPYIIADEKSVGLVDLWQIIPCEKEDPNNDYAYIVSAFSGLNIQAPSKAEIYPMVLDKHQSKSYNNELFTIEPTGEEGWFYLKNKNTKKYLSMSRQPLQGNYNFYNNILLNHFKIAPKHNTMVLRMQEGRAEMVFDGRDQFDPEAALIRAFTVSSVPGLQGYRLYCSEGTIAMTLDNGKSVTGTRLLGTKKPTASDPTFNFEKIADNLYKITLVKDPSLCIEVKNGDKGNKTPLVLAKYTGAPYQQFYLLDADTPNLIQTTNVSDLSKFRIEDAGPVDWKRR